MANVSVAGLWIIIVITGCGSATDDDPITCSESERKGTYLVHYEKSSGDCGAIPDSVSSLQETTGIPASGATECQSTQPDKWEDDKCKLTRSFTCVDASGLAFESVVITTQTTDDGSVITGVASVTARDPVTAVEQCTSSYDMTATRQ